MAHVFLPQHQRHLRRRNNVGSIYSANSRSRSRSRCSSLRLTCLTMGVICLIILIFASNFSNVRQHQLDWIDLDKLSKSLNNDASTASIPIPPSATTTATTTSPRSAVAQTHTTEMPTPSPGPVLLNIPPCNDQCQIHRRQRLEQSDGVDLLSIADMISSVQAKKQALLDTLGAPNQYGGLASQLFSTPGSGSGSQSLPSQLLEALDTTDNPSRERLRDKMQRKLLQVQLNLVQQDNRPTAADMDAAYRAAAAAVAAAAAPATTTPDAAPDAAPDTAPDAPEDAGYGSSVQDDVTHRLLQEQSEEKQQVDTDPSSTMDEYAQATPKNGQQVDTDPVSMNEYAQATVPSSTTPSPLVPYRFTQTRLVWATAGHGASAGHGNLADESYTAILQQAAGPVFGAAGIDLTTRNYGWEGATDKSAPELALCLDSVYGTDVDILAWDFEEPSEQFSQHSQQERRERERDHGWKRHMFWARVALQANRPAVIAMHLNDVPAHVREGFTGGESDSSQGGSASHPILQELDQLGAYGLTALGWNPSVMERIHKDIIPDAADSLPGEDEIMPANVRFFKCGGRVEAGPVCESRRFSDHAGKACRSRWYQDASHPGWKQHALTGNLMALFLVDVLLEALLELESSTEGIAARLARLDAVEKADNARFRSEAPSPKLPSKVFNPSAFSVTSNLFQQRSLCHTARLPSEMRYQGILTGRTAQEFDQFYREGMERNTADKLMSTMFDEGADTDNIDSAEMKLVYTETLRQSRRCNATLNIDYPDSFYVGPNEGWKSLKILTRLEKETYKIDSSKGLILVCLVQPNLYKKGFNDREIQVGNLKKHPLVDFRVNGQDVEELSWIDSCFALGGPHGHYWEIGSDGQYEIAARIVDNDDAVQDVLQISSVILL